MVIGSINIDDNYSLKNINARLHGTLLSGLINIDNLSINQGDRSMLNNVSGEISYISKGKSIYFSSSNFSNDQKYKLSFSGYKTSKLPSIKLKISSNLRELISPIGINPINNIDLKFKFVEILRLIFL